MLSRWWLFILPWLLGACAALAAPHEEAPRATTPKIDCVDGCTVTTDAYPYGINPELPSGCRLKNNGVLLKEFPPLSGNKCETRMNFPAGTYNLTMTAIDSAGVETAPSVPFAFESRRALPSPANLQVVP